MTNPDDPDITRKVTPVAAPARGDGGDDAAAAAAPAPPAPGVFSGAGFAGLPPRPTLAARLDALRAAGAPRASTELARVCQAVTELLGRSSGLAHGGEVVLALATSGWLLELVGQRLCGLYEAGGGAAAAGPVRGGDLEAQLDEIIDSVAALECAVAGDHGWLAPGESTPLEVEFPDGPATPEDAGG